MVDFRYHLVSLVAVFLALACGIALGAGPLRDAIGDTVSGRDAQLTTQNAELSTQNAELADERDAADAALDTAGAGLLGGTLPGYRVAVVRLGGVDDDVVTAVDARLAQAGAKVVSQATLANAWTDPSLQSFRQSLVGYLVGYLHPAPAANADVDAELAQALVDGLTGADAGDSDTPSGDASTLLQLLSSGDTPLVKLAATVTTPADAVVLLAPGSSSGSSSIAATATSAAAGTPSATPASAADVTAADVALLQAAQAGSKGAVLAETGAGPGPVVAAVTGDSGLAGTLSTVSGVDGVVGQVGVPLALAQRVVGKAGHYGPGTGLTPLPARAAAPAPR